MCFGTFTKFKMRRFLINEGYINSRALVLKYDILIRRFFNLLLSRLVPIRIFHMVQWTNFLQARKYHTRVMFLQPKWSLADNNANTWTKCPLTHTFAGSLLTVRVRVCWASGRSSNKVMISLRPAWVHKISAYLHYYTIYCRSNSFFTPADAPLTKELYTYTYRQLHVKRQKTYQCCFSPSPRCSLWRTHSPWQYVSCYHRRVRESRPFRPGAARSRSSPCCRRIWRRCWTLVCQPARICWKSR